VLETRAAPHGRRDQRRWQGDGIYRRRRCLGCRKLFATRETVDPLIFYHG
jgi:transcriptional regulator NrdR family protein